ncbi:CocE/NonD family hydrolase [Rickettsiella endosymbiont of Aleochara curtula]|uniref:CocE/NonD family hydrolase n=1 Tax=Rickettsiella endosymbiont of Aleochara curtula TaxID=3077936 RepID=UPI00313EBE7F
MNKKHSYPLVVDKLYIPMRDSLRLVADFLIKSDGIPHPVLLLRTPYMRQDALSHIDAINLARLGWAVVVQNVRGRIESEGSFLPFMQEMNDGKDTIEWLKKQSWCNGKIAMSGTSYVGYVQWCCAHQDIPGLGAISPQITASDIYKQWFFENGAFRHAFAQSWGLSFAYTASSKSDKETKEMQEYVYKLEKLYEYAPDCSPLRQFFKPYNDWLKSSDDPFWQQLPSIEKKIPSIPAFHLAGWYDIFCEGSLEDYSLMRNQLPKGYAQESQRLVIGPWSHTQLYSPIVGQLDFGVNADGFFSDTMNEIHEWLLAALEKKPVKGGARVFIMGENSWREFTTWPPTAETNVINLYLHSKDNSKSSLLKHSLEFSKPADFNEIKFFYEPASLPSPLGGRFLDPTLYGAPGPFNQSSHFHRYDLLLFVSSKLADSLTIVGKVTARLYLSTNVESLDIVMTLLDIYPDGSTYNMVSSVHRERLKKNEINIFDLDVGSTAITFGAGHCIGFKVASSNFPHTDLNPNRAIVQIYMGPNHLSHINLPVLGDYPKDGISFLKS